MDFYTQLESLKKDKKLTNKKLGEIIGSSSDAFRMALKRKSLSSLERRTLEQYFGFGSEDSEQGEVEALNVTAVHELAFTENKNGNNFMKLENGQWLMTMPLAEFNVQAGLLDHYQDLEYIKEMHKHSIIVDEPAKGRYMAFRVKGDSMDDGSSNAIVQGSIVSTRELQRQHWRSKIRYKDFPFWIIYTTQSRFPLLKEIVRHDIENGVIRCHSLNTAPEYTDFDLPLNDVQALFYVIDVSRQLSKKTIY